jgi:hypothetical protein
VHNETRLDHVRRLTLNTVHRHDWPPDGVRATTPVAPVDLPEPGCVETGFKRYVRAGITDADLALGSSTLRLDFDERPDEVVFILEDAALVDARRLAMSLVITAKTVTFGNEPLHITLVVRNYRRQGTVVVTRPFTVGDWDLYDNLTLVPPARGHVKIALSVIPHDEYLKRVGQRQYDLETASDTSSLVPPNIP